MHCDTLSIFGADVEQCYGSERAAAGRSEGRTREDNTENGVIHTTVRGRDSRRVHQRPRRCDHRSDQKLQPRNPGGLFVTSHGRSR
jgi:hypothetical protein